ncbi:unnamed protein product [Arctogadus glacialis]
MGGHRTLRAVSAQTEEHEHHYPPGGVTTLSIRDSGSWRQLSQETLDCSPQIHEIWLFPLRGFAQSVLHLDQLNFRRLTTLKPF